MNQENNWQIYENEDFPTKMTISCRDSKNKTLILYTWMFVRKYTEQACVCVQRLCFLHVHVRGVTGLSSQRSLMPLDPGRRLDGITGNWIVFHLLWKQPGRDTPQTSPPSHPSTSIPAVSFQSTPPPPSLVHPVPNPLWRHVAQSPCFYMSSKVSPCSAEILGWMLAECSIKQLLAQYQQQRCSTV